jgi:hypothetical protein
MLLVLSWPLIELGQFLEELSGEDGSLSNSIERRSDKCVCPPPGLATTTAAERTTIERFLDIMLCPVQMKRCSVYI